MINTLRPYKTAISASLLACFFLALGGLLVCHLEEDALVSDHMSIHQDKTSLSFSVEPMVHQHTSEYPQNHPSTSECCDDQSDNFFSGLVKHKQYSFTFAKSAFPFTTSGFTFQSDLGSAISLKIKIDVILNNLPPPKISDIRILFQSFLK